MSTDAGWTRADCIRNLELDAAFQIYWPNRHVAAIGDRDVVEWAKATHPDKLDALTKAFTSAVENIVGLPDA